MSGLNLNPVGFIIVGPFVAIRAVALAVWRWRRIEEKWTATNQSPPGPPWG